MLRLIDEAPWLPYSKVPYATNVPCPMRRMTNLPFHSCTASNHHPWHRMELPNRPFHLLLDDIGSDARFVVLGPVCFWTCYRYQGFRRPPNLQQHDWRLAAWRLSNDCPNLLVADIESNSEVRTCSSGTKKLCTLLSPRQHSKGNEPKRPSSRATPAQ